MPTPKISLNQAAIDAFAGAIPEGGSDFIHLRIDPSFGHDLYVGPKEAGEIEVPTEGPVLLLDEESGGRAEGLTVKFVTGEEGSGFQFDNPNAPPSVIELSPREIKALLDKGEVDLFDVRPENERKIASVAEARPLDAGGEEYLKGLDKNRPVAFLCHHGVRSMTVAEYVIEQGFRVVYNVVGGIDFWTTQVDPTLRRY